MNSQRPQDPETVTSQTLLLRVRDPDDIAAWDEFVQRYAPRIFGWCRQNRLQDSDAADVTQEVLCKLVSAMQRFEYDRRRGRFRGWLKTVTSNAVRDMVAKLQKSGRGAGGGGADATGVPDALDQLVDQRATQRLAELIEEGFREELLRNAECSVRQRVQPSTWQAYVMAAVEQHAAADVARELEIRVSDVYVAKSRVIKLLREEVARQRALEGLDDD